MAPTIVMDSRGEMSFNIEAEHTVVCQAKSLLDAFTAGFACYAVFDICYHRKFKRTLIFIQKAVLQIVDKEKPPQAVLQLMQSLNDIE